MTNHFRSAFRASKLRKALQRRTTLLLSALALSLSVATAQVQVAARPADSFVESIGINTHFEYPSYSNYEGLKKKLGESGIRYVRGGINRNFASKSDDLYASFGIRHILVMGRRLPGPWPQPLDLSQIDAELSDIKALNVAAFVGLEGPNEYDIMQGPNEQDWVGKLQNYTKTFYAKAKADATLKNLPIIGPSLVRYESYDAVGNLDPWIDYTNIHPYFGQHRPGDPGWGGNGYGSIRWWQNEILPLQSPSGKPNQATECSYHNDYITRTRSNGDLYNEGGISEEAEGKYTARMFAEFYRTGLAVRSYKYELLSQSTDGYKENTFGLLRNDLSEKPSFRAVKNLISVLSDKGASFTPGSLNYTITGSTADLRQQLFQKRNGDFYLMLWLEKPSWESKEVKDATGKIIRFEHKDLYPAAQTVTLTVPATIASATKYELNNNSDMSTAAVAISSGVLALSVSDKVMIVKLAPHSGPLPTTNAAQLGAGLTAYPNPSRGSAATLAFTAAQAQHVSVAVYDPLGRLVKTLHVRAQAGPNDVALPLTGLAPGFYVVRVAGPSQVQTTRLVVE